MAARDDRQQFAPLVRIFVARFFENDMTSSAHDLERSFFGLVAILGVPGALVPILMSFDWSLVGRYEGIPALRILSRADKDLYLGFTMIAAAVVSALTWNTLLIDRRDAVVLGSLPVRPRMIVLAKLSALAIYVGAIAVTMHTLSAATWGLFLDQGSGGSLEFLLRGIAAHFAAGCAASAFTVLLIMSVQGLLLAIGGPRIFVRVSGAFQIGLVVAIAYALIAFPGGSELIVDAVKAPVNPATHWALTLPPAWFLGVYEVILGGFGGFDPEIRRLATTAGLATLVVFVVGVASNIVAYRRVMRGAVEEETGRTTPLGSIGRWVAHLTTRRPDLRAVAEFYLTSIARVERQRLAVGIGVGAAIAWAVPIVQRWPSLVDSPTPAIPLLTLPVSLMVLWLVALRVAASLPADLKASWLFEIQRPRPEDVRAVIERVFLIIGVAPFVLLAVPVVWTLWGADVALLHAVFTCAIGTLLVEMLLNRGGDVPGTQPWRPERARLRARWPIYLVGFLWLANGLPFSLRPGWELETLLIAAPVARLVFLGLLAGIAFAIRWRAIQRLRTEPTEDPDVPEDAAVTVRLN
jgi:hypothetical protein